MIRASHWLRPHLVLAAFAVCAGAQTPKIEVAYPLEGSVFPPEFPAPTFLWRDAVKTANVWMVEAAGHRIRTNGPPMPVGRIDSRCVSSTNKPPVAPPGHSWKPDEATWTAIKRAGTATITITGYRDPDLEHPVSRGQVSIVTSTDRVDAPIFYRDVPLMPAETVQGVIQPLAKSAVPLIAWRLRDVAKTTSNVVMTGIYSCANCHSVSTDGKTMGMDLDGPRNDKGLYAMFAIRQRSTIRDENVVAWSTFQGKLGGKLRVGFMSQVSPHGDFVVTTINDPGAPQTQYERRKNPRELISSYYVANFKDYRFLQVFYPTRGILAWYSPATGKLQPLPGADDPGFVHTNAVWSPDGQYLVFARAKSRDAYPEGSRLAERANDPNETAIQYDLYRIPFNNGMGGTAERIEGASANGMSNSFPKISPDGRWIVYVQAKNGQLMRPDGQLYIVPAAGGAPRKMRCNTPLMNSWHSFSPNGRWMVFSSKSRSPYTQMFLTHIDENGEDSPAILIEDATAANRAVNIPEFINIKPQEPFTIDAPVTEYYKLLDTAEAQLSKAQYTEALANLRLALAKNAEDAVVRNSLGVALSHLGRLDEAIQEYRKAAELSPDFPDTHANLGAALLNKGMLEDAVRALERAVALDEGFAGAHTNLGAALAQLDRIDRALPHMRRAVELAPDDANANRNLALALFDSGRKQEAMAVANRALKLAQQSRNPQLIAEVREMLAEFAK
jgi:Flp pilus assembly protein TadD